jgi:hypothetical protein
VSAVRECFQTHLSSKIILSANLISDLVNLAPVVKFGKKNTSQGNLHVLRRQLFSAKNLYKFSLSFLFSPLVPTQCRCRGLLLHLVVLRHTALRRTPLDKWSVRRNDLYLTTHNTHNKQTSMPAVGFEPAFPASERPQTHVLDRPATGIGPWKFILQIRKQGNVLYF